jgi:hypothetical protein
MLLIDKINRESAAIIAELRTTVEKYHSRVIELEGQLIESNNRSFTLKSALDEAATSIGDLSSANSRLRLSLERAEEDIKNRDNTTPDYWDSATQTSQVQLSRDSLKDTNVYKLAFEKLTETLKEIHKSSVSKDFMHFSSSEINSSLSLLTSPILSSLSFDENVTIASQSSLELQSNSVPGWREAVNCINWVQRLDIMFASQVRALTVAAERQECEETEEKKEKEIKEEKVLSAQQKPPRNLDRGEILSVNGNNYIVSKNDNINTHKSIISSSNNNISNSSNKNQNPGERFDLTPASSSAWELISARIVDATRALSVVADLHASSWYAVCVYN